MTTALPDFIPALVDRLQAIPGVRGVALGGSHATGTATEHSDIDLSLAYDGTGGFDLDALATLCRDLDDTHDAVPSPVGGWGPWVDGGAWLTVQGKRVDFIYRDVNRVRQSVQDALSGRVALHASRGTRTAFTRTTTRRNSPAASSCPTLPGNSRPCNGRSPRTRPPCPPPCRATTAG